MLTRGSLTEHKIEAEEDKSKSMREFFKLCL